MGLIGSLNWLTDSHTLLAAPPWCVWCKLGLRSTGDGGNVRHHFIRPVLDSGVVLISEPVHSQAFGSAGLT